MLRSFTVKLPTLPYMCPVMRKDRKEEIYDSSYKLSANSDGLTTYSKGRPTRADLIWPSGQLV